MNTKNLVLKNTSGFGLLGTVVAMGIASILFMSIMDMLAVSASTQRGIQIKADRSAFMGNLSNVLLQDPTCTPSLKGNDVTQPLVMRDPSNTTKMMAMDGMHFPAWDISSLTLQNQRVVDPSMNLYSADVVITLTHPYRVIGITPVSSKQIASIYYTANAGTITRCFGATDWASVGKKYCATMGGAWSDTDILCTLPTTAAIASTTTSISTTASSTTVASNTPSTTPCDEKDHLTVSEVVASATNGKNSAINNTPAAGVITGVVRSVGNDKH